MMIKHYKSTHGWALRFWTAAVLPQSVLKVYALGMIIVMRTQRVCELKRHASGATGGSLPRPGGRYASRKLTAKAHALAGRTILRLS